MKKSINIGWGSLRVGLLVVFAVVVLLWVTFTGGGSSFFQPKNHFVCFFENTGGMVSGAPVWLSGVEVGNVADIDYVNLDSARQVRVVCSIKESVWKSVTHGSYVSLGTIGFIGDRYISVTPGPVSAEAIKVGDTLPTRPLATAAAMFQAGENAFSQAGSLVTNLDSILARMNRGDGTLGRISTDDALYVQMTQLMTNLSRLTADLQRNQERLIGSIERLSTSTAELTDKVNENKGSIGRLINDPALYDNLAATSARLDTIMTKINAAEGSAGLLVNDTALYVEVTNLLVRVNNLVTDIQANPRKYFKFSVF